MNVATMTESTPTPTDRRLGRSIAAILVGFFAVAGLSLGTDQVLHLLKVYPDWGEPMWSPLLNLLALSYRVVYAVLGSFLAGRLAPRAPMRHAMLLGWIGLPLAVGGAIVALTVATLGPVWYPIALALTTLPCAWLGGVLATRTSNLIH